MYKNILICLDGSQLAEQVLPVAVETARANNSRLILLRTVFEYALVSPGIPGYSSVAVTTSNYTKRLEADLDMASTYLDKVAASLGEETGLDVVKEIGIGTPGKSIVDYAVNNDIDLIVLATHGHGGLERAVFGSTADYVLKRSHIPNLIVRPKSIESLDEGLVSQPPIRKLLVPLDGSRLAEQILPFAVEQARLLSSKLALVQVIDAPETEVTVGLKATAAVAEKENDYYDAEEKDARNYLMSLADSYQQSAVNSEYMVLRGEHPEKLIVDYAERNGFDMVAMCTHGRSGLNRMVFGSVADHILRNTGMPLLVLRPQYEK